MNALDLIVKEIDEKLQQLNDFLSWGNAKSYDEYKAICGEMRGLSFAKEYTLSLKHKLENEDE